MAATASRVAALEAAVVPQLASSSGGAGGLPYAVWRPQMKSYLMRAGFTEADYAREIDSYAELCAALEAEAQRKVEDAMALLLGKKSASAAKAEPRVENREQQAARESVAEAIARTRRAYGILFASLPGDLRLLVAGVPHGYAYGIWSFLESKYRSTERDNVADLWKQLILLEQEVDEEFAAYKARVDAAKELLAHAREETPASLYTTVLLWRLRPSYAPAVLALQASKAIGDAAKIDWPAVAAFMANHERSQQRLGERDVAEADHAMAARGTTTRRSKSSMRCYCCGEKGHMARECARRRGNRRRERDRSPGSLSHSSSEDDDEETLSEGRTKERVNMARRSGNPVAPSDEEYKYTGGVLAGQSW